MIPPIKFPKTPRYVEEQDLLAWGKLRATVEEKVDGANVGIWFDTTGGLMLQSRGHVLRGGADERQFAPLHGWAASRLDALRVKLGANYVLYGDWCYAKHRAFYDALPDWFIGYDVLDRQASRFLDVKARDAILRACGIEIAPRLWQGLFGKIPFGALIGPSRFKTPQWKKALMREALRAKASDPMGDTDDSLDLEGLYIRVETEGNLVGRVKLHRIGFEKVRSDHWRERPLIRNALRA